VDASTWPKKDRFLQITYRPSSRHAQTIQAKHETEHNIHIQMSSQVCEIAY
jgi:hypothetical protein